MVFLYSSLPIIRFLLCLNKIVSPTHNKNNEMNKVLTPEKYTTEYIVSGQTAEYVNGAPEIF